MAISKVADLGHNNGAPSTALTVCTIGVGGVPAGDSILVAVDCQVSDPTSVTDTRGNTYVKDINGGAGTGLHGSLWRAYITTPLVSGDTIVVNCASQALSAAAAQFTGMANAAPEVSNVLATGSSTTPVSNSVTTLTNGDLVVAVVPFAIAATYNAAGAPWAAAATWTRSSSNSGIGFDYQVQSTAGAVQHTGATFTVSGSWYDFIAAYKAAATAADLVVPQVIQLG